MTAPASAARRWAPRSGTRRSPRRSRATPPQSPPASASRLSRNRQAERGEAERAPPASEAASGFAASCAGSGGIGGAQRGEAERAPHGPPDELSRAGLALERLGQLDARGADPQPFEGRAGAGERPVPAGQRRQRAPSSCR